MNNAAYFSHAEFARWEWMSENGTLEGMLKAKAAFLVAGATIRYRRDIRPLFRTFRVESYLAQVDERDLWINHTFHHAEKGDGRARTQVLVRGAVVQGKKGLINPMEFFNEYGGIPMDVLDRLKVGEGETTALDHENVAKYKTLDDSMKAAAAEDDKTRD